MTTEPQLVATDTEREVLVAALIYAECASAFDELMRPEYFCVPQYAALAGEFLHQRKGGDGFDPATAARNLMQHRAFPGGNDDVVSLVRDLSSEYASRHQFPFKCAALVETSRKRDQLMDLHQLQSEARNGFTSNDICRATLETVARWKEQAAGFGRRDRFTFGELRRDYPVLRPAVLDGLARQGETVNIISHAKAGKSWFGYLLAFAIITGSRFLGRFQATQGRVLLIDNELHRPTIAYRVNEVAMALGIQPSEYEQDFEVLSLRGNLRTLSELAIDLGQIERGEFAAIIWDSKYRFGNAIGDENSNAAETDVYNLIDQIGDRTGACQILIHHTSKGNQSDRKVTDVGSGAGAQSRAADCHMVLREHEEEGLAVLEAAVRSFAPVEAMAIRWSFPMWVADSSVDPARLKRAPTGNQVRQEAEDRKGMELVIGTLRDGPSTARKLREATAIGKDRMERLLGLMRTQGHVTTQTITVRGNECNEYTLCE